ncbi:YihY/virulence factor BrkB family protein [Aliidiomarina maris]|uniref:Membrane protein n=1 Tax=Aliidiomarina maris TaxID=531312 RepID=A0A327WRI6_9GAMM|nr:YihY/virulence factor BrkB family protein [Aliidiomarina maris]RAJ93286.1 membrane protein [Aliidiomarina maris]RUO18542.1 hypothetical protein CWE07_13665 [Aliidiomarina maris]
MPTGDTSPQSPNASSNDRYGRQATNPWQITWRGWYQIGQRVANNVQKHNISLVAAGVALFVMLSIFPALNAAVVLYALVSSPEAIIAQLEPLRQILPQQAYDLLTEQLSSLADEAGVSLSWTLVLSIAVWFWVSRRGAKALITACNIIYEEHEKRPFWGLLLVSMLFTVIGILGFVALAALAIVLPIALNMVPMGESVETLLSTLRWPLLALIFILVLQSIYRFAPNRKNAKWRWVSVGAVIATLCWLGASYGFTVYVQNFTNYNETYGAIGSVIVLILWFYISAFVVLLGAEINAEMEHQTEVDSTVGKDKPMGERGAYMADTVGSEPEPEDQERQ